MVNDKIVIGMSRDMKKWLQETANELGISTSEFVRHKLLDDYTKRKRKV